MGVLEHGHRMSPYIVNHFMMDDCFFQSLDLQLIIFRTSDLKKKGFYPFIFLLVCIFLLLLQGVQSISTASHAAQNSQELVLSVVDV